ncbi:unknown [Firmicutes bacterium CAG:882]|nr:unknown [Firmicutes bacterium CAG:882]
MVLSMDEIVAYFKGELNKADFKRKNLENQVQCIHNEFDKLTERENSISVREDAPDYVFQVDCYEKSLDREELIKIKNRKEELEKELSDIKEELQINKTNVDKYRRLYEMSLNKNGKGLKLDIYNKLEFILQLMDNDIVRAKLELVGILKEESADAN